ncbi:hypothetical protein [Dyadobacter bucti]|jgi:hypothetical protein
MNLLIHVLYVKKIFLEIIGMKNGGRGQKNGGMWLQTIIPP